MARGRGGAAASAAAAAPTAAAVAAAADAQAAFGYAVTRQEDKGLRGRRLPESVRKLRFMSEELVSDLAFAGWRSLDFWIQLTVIFIALYLRVYLHYLAQWLFLRSLRVPVYDLNPTPYNVVLKYVADVLPFEVELGVVIVGPAGVVAATALFSAFAYACLRMFYHIPGTLSLFFAWFGIGAALDPLLITLVDAIAGFHDCDRFRSCAADIASRECECHEGDAWKLYQRFRVQEGSGVAGVILVVFLYAVLILAGFFFVYLYLLHLHMDGRMLDLYRRLNAPEEAFLVPHDFEVSAAELQWIVGRAARWRGAKGTARRIAVCDYVVTDPLDASYREVTSHLVIYHAGLDGARELYRHFLRLPDGVILEVFGDIERHFGLKTAALQALLGGGGGGGVGTAAPAAS
jgi:hypothetical protein